jgi:hypothetical protein
MRTIGSTMLKSGLGQQRFLADVRQREEAVSVMVIRGQSCSSRLASIKE